MKKRIFIILVFVLSILILTACGTKKDVKFKLTIPAEISSNVTNLDEIDAGTEIVLIVNVPTNKEVNSFKVNNEEKTLVNNEYTFIIIEDTNVSVTFKDIVSINYYSLTLDEGVTTTITNLDSIEENTLVTLTITEPVNKEVETFKINGVIVTLTSNVYSFNINEDTVVTISFIDVDEPKTYYSLTIPNMVSSNIVNKDQVLENSEVTLMVNLDPGYELLRILVNDVEVTLTNNEYTFNITKDTIVVIVYVDVWVDVTLNDANDLIDSFDISLFKEGTLKVTKFEEEDRFKIESLEFYEIDEYLNITESYITYNMYFDDILTDKIYEYYDSEYAYYITEEYDSDGIILNVYENVNYFDTSMQAIEVFGSYLTEESFMYAGLNSTNDLFKYLIDHKKEDLKSGLLLGNVSLSKKGNLKHLEIETLNFDSFNLITYFNRTSDIDHIDILYDESLNELNLNLGGTSLINLRYADYHYQIDERLLLIDNSNVSYLTYNYHFKDYSSYIIKFDQREGNSLVHYIGFDVLGLIPYIKDKKVVGLYLDQDYTQELELIDFRTDNLNIYVKLEDIKTYEQILTTLISDNYIYINRIGYDEFYYEDDNYLYYEYPNNNAILIDKVNQDLYEIIFDSGGSYTSYILDYEKNLPYMLEILLELSNKDFLMFKGRLIYKTNDFIFNGTNLIINRGYFDDNIFEGIPNVSFEKKEGLFDITIFDDYINNSLLPDMSHVRLISENTYIDVNNIDNEMDLYITYYNISNMTKITFAELIDYDTTYKIEDNIISFEYDNKTVMYDQYFFYDSTKGHAVIVDEDSLYYLDEMSGLPNIEINEYFKLLYFQTSYGLRIENFDDLLDIDTTEPYTLIYSVVDKLNPEETLDKLNESSSIKFTYNNYDVLYDLTNRLFYIERLSNSLVIKIDKDYYHFSNEDSYFAIPKELFDMDDFMLHNGESNYPFFHLTLRTLWPVLLSFDEALNEQVDATKGIIRYDYDNGLNLSVEYQGIYIKVGNRHYIINEYDVLMSINIDADQQYKFTIYNDVSLPITMNINNVLNIISYNYNFSGYFIQDYYYVDDNNDPLYDQRFDKEGWVEEDNYIYANYIELEEPVSYFEVFKENNMFIFNNFTYIIKVDLSNQIEIYKDEELYYFIDLNNNKYYYFENDVLYEIHNNEKVFNFVDFVDSLTNEMFIFNNINEYMLKKEAYDLSLEFIYYLNNNNLRIAHESLESRIYLVSIEDFQAIDQEMYFKDQEEIINIDVFTEMPILSVNNLESLTITLEFNTPIIEVHTYLDFSSKYDSYYEDGFIYFKLFDEDMEIDLSLYGISVYDESIDQVVVFGLDSFSYLGDLESLPTATNRPYEVFDKWMYEFYTPVNTIEDLNLYNDPVIFLSRSYRIPTIDEIIPFIQSKEYVDIQLNYRNYSGLNSTSLNFKYSFEDDMFVLVRNNRPVTVSFNNDIVSVRTLSNFIQYNMSIFKLRTGLTNLEIDNYNQTIEDLREYRKLLLGEYTGTRVEDFYYYNNGKIKLRVEPNLKRISFIAGNSNYHFMNFNEPLGEIATPNPYQYILLVETRFSEQSILISGNSMYMHQNFIFDVEDYDFENYYLYDEEGEVNYDEILQPHEYDFLRIYGNYTND